MLGELGFGTKVFKQNDIWTKVLPRKDCYPVLYGDLTQLLLSEGDRKKHEDRRNKPLICLAIWGLAKVRNVEKLKKVLLASLRSTKYSVETSEVEFPDFILHIGGALSACIEMPEPRDILIRGTMLIHLVYWFGKSTNVVTVEPTMGAADNLIIRHVQGGRTFRLQVLKT